MHRFLKRWLVAGLLTLAGLAHAQDTKLPVTASFSVLADIVHNVGGDRVSVTSVVGPDTDARLYQPTPADADKLSDTAVFFVNGLGLEPWLPKLLTLSRYKGPVVTVTQGLKPRIVREHGRNVPDPYMFQDPDRVKAITVSIRDALIAADPAGRAYYTERAHNYTLALDDLITWAHKQFAPISPGRRVVLTPHDAFGYLGERFDIRFLSPQGVSVANDPSPRELARLARQVRLGGVRAVFIDNVSNPRLLERVAHDARVKVNGKLYSDALSQTQEAANYLQLFQHNIRAMVAAMKDSR